MLKKSHAIEETDTANMSSKQYRYDCVNAALGLYTRFAEIPPYSVSDSINWQHFSNIQDDGSRLSQIRYIRTEFGEDWSVTRKKRQHCSRKSSGTSRHLISCWICVLRMRMRFKRDSKKYQLVLWIVIVSPTLWHESMLTTVQALHVDTWYMLEDAVSARHGNVQSRGHTCITRKPAVSQHTKRTAV